MGKKRGRKMRWEASFWVPRIAGCLVRTITDSEAWLETFLRREDRDEGLETTMDEVEGEEGRAGDPGRGPYAPASRPRTAGYPVVGNAPDPSSSSPSSLSDGRNEIFPEHYPPPPPPYNIRTKITSPLGAALPSSSFSSSSSSPSRPPLYVSASGSLPTTSRPPRASSRPPLSRPASSHPVRARSSSVVYQQAQGVYMSMSMSMSMSPPGGNSPNARPGHWVNSNYSANMNSSSPFHQEIPPAISVGDYLERLRVGFQCCPAALFAALRYLEQAAQTDAFLTPSDRNVHRLFLTVRGTVRVRVGVRVITSR